MVVLKGHQPTSKAWFPYGLKGLQSVCVTLQTYGNICPRRLRRSATHGRGDQESRNLVLLYWPLWCFRLRQFLMETFFWDDLRPIGTHCCLGWNMCHVLPNQTWEKCLFRTKGTVVCCRCDRKWGHVSVVSATWRRPIANHGADRVADRSQTIKWKPDLIDCYTLSSDAIGLPVLSSSDQNV